MALHWLLAALIVANFALGIYMHELPFSMTRLKLYNWHKWAGVVILTLSACTLAWRLTHRPPADLPMPAWQSRAAHAAHLALYVLFFAVPLAGWAYSSAAGFPVVLFGVLPLPDFVPVTASCPSLERNARIAGLTLAASCWCMWRRPQAPVARPRRPAAQRMRPATRN
jgi:cytochrome b561